MPFGYFGAKHALAKFYPAPTHPRIIEPFAGSAGYALYWAARMPCTVLLVDSNPDVIALWHKLQQMTEADLPLQAPPKGTLITDPLVASASGQQGMATLAGKTRSVTDRMIETWPRIRARIVATLPFIRNWAIVQADYSQIPNFPATWFIDPPYKRRVSEFNGGAKTAGGHWYSVYGHGMGDAAYKDLGSWILSRKGQVIACEQDPANWLPFVPFRSQRNGVGAGRGSTRLEVIYTQDDKSGVIPKMDSTRLGRGNVVTATDKALFIKLDNADTPVWVPKSVIHDDSEVYRHDSEPGEVVVLEWWAEKNGYA